MGLSGAASSKTRDSWGATFSLRSGWTSAFGDLANLDDLDDDDFGEVVEPEALPVEINSIEVGGLNTLNKYLYFLHLLLLLLLLLLLIPPPIGGEVP